jgi:hypothetical protein
MIAVGTVVAVSTVVAAVAVLAASASARHTVDMTDSVALRAVFDVAFAGTLAQISLLSSVFVWEKYRHWRGGLHGLDGFEGRGCQ